MYNENSEVGILVERGDFCHFAGIPLAGRCGELIIYKH